MSKNRSAAGITNIVQYDANKNITFVSGSTTLLTVSSSGALTTTSTITAQTLVVQTITSSVNFVTGSTKFGVISSNTHQFTGSMYVTGAFSLSGGQLGISNTVSGTPVRLDVNTGTGTGSFTKLAIGTGGTYGTATNKKYLDIDFNGYNNYTQARIRSWDENGTTGYGSLYFYTNSTAGTDATNLAMALNYNGNVIIGGTTGGEKLNLANGGAIAFQNTSNTQKWHIQHNAGSDGLNFVESAVADFRLFLKAGGYVGINNGNPQSRLHIAGAGGSEISFAIYDSSSRRTFFIPSQYYGYMWAVAIVSNGGKAWSFGNENGSEVGTIVINAGGVAYNTTSDYRLKEDLKDFNGLDKVSKIKVYDFKWKNLNERTNGVLAHELAEVLPYAVSGVKDALNHEGKIEAKSFDYYKLTPVLVKAIQELKAEIDALKAQ